MALFQAYAFNCRRKPCSTHRNSETLSAAKQAESSISSVFLMLCKETKHAQMKKPKQMHRAAIDLSVFLSMYYLSAYNV